MDHNQITINWGNILITKNKDLIINFEIPPADHLIRKFILNPVESSRSAPTRNHNIWSRVDNEHQVSDD